MADNLANIGKFYRVTTEDDLSFIGIWAHETDTGLTTFLLVDVDGFSTGNVVRYTHFKYVEVRRVITFEDVR